MIILDNFRSHHAKLTRETAEKLSIDLVFLPPYSPNLNPIEFIWKSIKRELSPLFIKTKEEMRRLIKKHFKKYSQSLTYASKWIKKFLKKSIKK
jgi:putative transposase